MGYIRIICEVNMKKIELYGETYYKFEEIKIFIEECRKRKKVY